MDPGSLQFGGGMPPPDHPAHHFANLHGLGHQVGSRSSDYLIIQYSPS